MGFRYYRNASLRSYRFDIAAYARCEADIRYGTLNCQNAVWYNYFITSRWRHATIDIDGRRRFSQL